MHSAVLARKQELNIIETLITWLSLLSVIWIISDFINLLFRHMIWGQKRRKTSRKRREKTILYQSLQHFVYTNNTKIVQKSILQYLGRFENSFDISGESEKKLSSDKVWNNRDAKDWRQMSRRLHWNTLLSLQVFCCLRDSLSPIVVNSRQPMHSSNNWLTFHIAIALAIDNDITVVVYGRECAQRSAQLAINTR